MALLTVLLCAVPRVISASDRATTPEDRPRRPVREALRTFAADGRYLVTFPARATRRGVLATAGVLVGTALLIGHDDEIRQEVIASDRRGPDRLAAKLEPLGRLHVEAAGLGLLYAAGRWRGEPRIASTAATAFEAYVWTTIITSTAKGAFGRERPSSGEADAHDFFEGGTIFPSGHTSRSFAIAAVLADRHGRGAAFTAYPLAALIGLATVRQDTHWASDLLAGAGLGLAIGKGIAARHPWPGAAPRPGAARSSGNPGRGISWQVLPARGGARVAISY
jgi:membrane-associated phospholipid phosphatase